MKRYQSNGAEKGTTRRGSYYRYNGDNHRPSTFGVRWLLMIRWTMKGVDVRERYADNVSGD